VNQWLDSTKGTAMDWAKWHDLYDVSTPLKERLIAVREQIAAAASKVAGKSLHLVSICAGDGRDVIGTFAASDERQDVHATLIESNPELVTRGQAAVDQLGLARRITFRCADATQSSTYVDIRPAHIIVLSGVFGNLKERDVQRLIAALPSLCDRAASVIWTRNLFDDGEKATQIIRQCFVAADFTEEVLVRTSLGFFAVGTHSFRGVRWPLQSIKLCLSSQALRASRGLGLKLQRPA
jgi:hypothetical protein